VINHLKTEIMPNYILQAQFAPRSKHTPKGFKINQLMLYGKQSRFGGLWNSNGLIVCPAFWRPTMDIQASHTFAAY
jgi:hypothetical protein